MSKSIVVFHQSTYFQSLAMVVYFTVPRRNIKREMFIQPSEYDFIRGFFVYHIRESSFCV